MKLYILLILPLGLGLASCDKKQTLQEKQAEIQNGALDASNRYTAAEIGWTTDIPGEWSVQSKKATGKITGDGLKAIEAANGGTIDTSGLKSLLNLEKDRSNSFMSSIEPYDEAKNGPWKKNHAGIISLIEKSYANAGMKNEKAIQGTEEIDGLEFQTAQLVLHHPSTGDVFMKQKMYSRLLHGFTFSMSISYNNEVDKAAMEKIIHSSKFSVRD